jgi:hypothetical protein
MEKLAAAGETRSVMWLAIGKDGLAEGGLTGRVTLDQAAKMLSALDRALEGVKSGVLRGESPVNDPTGAEVSEAVANL